MAGAPENEKAPVPVDYKFLEKDELQYELRIRGMQFRPDASLADASLADLRELIRRHHKRDALTEEVSKLVPREELEALEPKIDELQRLITERSVLRDLHQEPSRLGTLYVHAVCRLRRIQFRAQGPTYTALCKLNENLQIIHSALKRTFPGYAYPAFPVTPGDMSELLRATQRMSVSTAQEVHRTEDAAYASRALTDRTRSVVAEDASRRRKSHEVNQESSEGRRLWDRRENSAQERTRDSDTAAPTEEGRRGVGRSEEFAAREGRRQCDYGTGTRKRVTEEHRIRSFSRRSSDERP